MARGLAQWSNTVEREHFNEALIDMLVDCLARLDHNGHAGPT